MFVYDLYKYNEVLDLEIIERIEETRNCKLLFMAACSSKVYGYDDANSDYDFRAFFEDKERLLIEPLWFEKNGELVEISFVNIYLLSGNISNITKMKDLSDFRNLPEDYFSTQKYLAALYSDYIWDSGYLLEHIDDILATIDIGEVTKYYLLRCKMNLRERMTKDVVKGKDLMKLVAGYGVLKALVCDHEIPYVDVRYVIATYLSDEHQKYMLDVLNGIKTMQIAMTDSVNVNEHLRNKKNYMVYNNKEFVDWMEGEMNLLEAEIARIGDNRAAYILLPGEKAFFFRK